MHRTKRHVRLAGIACIAGLLFGTGCASMRSPQPGSILTRWSADRWVADYDTAERLVRRTNRGMLLYYKSDRLSRTDSMKRSLDSPEVERQVRDHVRCMLFKAYEPDRRYVAQYGVQRAPALILVHRDGTYHTRSGPMSTDEIVQFLADATPPGAQPVFNPQVPRRVTYDWHRKLAAAQGESDRTGRPILVVYRRRLSGDWRGLGKLLSRREVKTRLAGLVHCRITTNNPWARTSETPFGTLKLPALVMAHRDGTHHVLERPTSSEAVVRFADRRTRPGATSDTDSVTAAAAEP